MQAYKKYLLITAIILLSSCSKKFLDLHPDTYENGSNFFKSEDDIISAVNGVYAMYQSQLDTYIEMTEMRSDNTCNEYNPNLRALPSTDREALDEFTNNSTNIYTNYWSVGYQAIYRVNVILNKINTINFNDTSVIKSRSIGECEFTRAWFYFNLVRFYGEVPLILMPVDVAESFSVGRSPVQDIYTQILSDVNDAIQRLPDNYSGSDVGRITKGAALTLLAKIQMTQGNFKDAVTTLQQIMSLGYSLMPDYQDCFNPADKNNPESIFEIQFSSSIPGQSNGDALAWLPYGSSAWQALFSYTGGNQYGYDIPTKDLVAAYEPGDSRKNISIGMPFTDSAGNEVPVAYIKKWLYIDPVPYRNDCNFQVYRYADVLLMLAESLNEVGYQGSGEALNLLNQVRQRAGLKDLTTTDVSDQTSFRLAIYHEERVELAFEGHRWFNLIRTGRAISVMNAYGQKELADPSTPFLPGGQYITGSFNVQKFQLLYPVPQSEIDKNPSKLTQNDGY